MMNTKKYHKVVINVTLNCKRIEMRKITIGLVSQVSSQSSGLGGYWGGVGNGGVVVMWQCVYVYAFMGACMRLRASVSVSVCE